jgi:hypothetical protein
MQDHSFYTKQNHTIHVTSLGNSVSESFGFGTTKGFLQILQSRFGHLDFVFQEGLRASGGYGLAHVEACGINHPSIVRSDIFIFQYSMYGNQLELAERMVRKLLTLPQAPLVVMVGHCQREDLREWPAFDQVNTTELATVALTHDKWGQMWFDGWQRSKSVSHTGTYQQFRDMEQRFAKYYNLPYFDTCQALGTLVDPIYDSLKAHKCSSTSSSAGSTSHSFDSFDDVIKHQFHYQGGDPMHYSKTGVALQACLLAQSFLAGQDYLSHHPQPHIRSNSTTSTSTNTMELLLPPPMFPDSKFGASLFCAKMTDDTPTGFKHSIQTSQTVGWTQKQGGRGGKKVWIEALDANSRLVLITPPATKLTMEYYRHHDLPMGAVEIHVDGTLVHKELDGCCETDCIQGAPHQGLYHSVDLADNLVMQPHNVTILTIAKNKTKCLELGSQFDITTIIGRGPEE